jgi:hypothetical protein
VVSVVTEFVAVMLMDISEVVAVVV